MPKKSAVEILLCKPDSAIRLDQKGVHENLRIKQRFEQYVSIGVYLEGADLKYYFFKECDNTPKIYSSLVELKQKLPNGLEDIFDNTPKLFIMGHARGDEYGLGNGSVALYETNFDTLIKDFVAALSPQHGEICVTMEACNTDNGAQAIKGGQKKTFLERVSETHQHITFCGTGPWDPSDPQTGYRASGGFPRLNAPITSMGGGIWKQGNSVIFYHDNYQVVVIKSMFASRQTAKELKVNTLAYAREILKLTSLDSHAREEMIKSICANRDILKIVNLKKAPGFPQSEFESQAITNMKANEKKILEKEKNNYIVRAQEILERAASGEKFTERDTLIIALGLKDLSLFQGHEDLLDKILDNHALLTLVMVACGKVLVAGSSNEAIIDFLLKKGIDINSADEEGMTALHYAVQNFYNYRKEPLNLIIKLLDCGATLYAEDKAGRTPLMLATDHGRKNTVIAGGYLLLLLEQKLVGAAPGNAYTMRPLVSPHLGFLRKVDEYLEEHRHNPGMQGEYDKRFGLLKI